MKTRFGCSSVTPALMKLGATLLFLSVFLVFCADIVHAQTNTKVNTLYRFHGGADGKTPLTLFQGSSGDFYGATQVGGANGNGTVFTITSAGSLNTLHDFTASEGVSAGGLVQGGDGNLYGSTRGTGGAIFKLTPAGEYSTFVDSFIANTLIKGNDGNLYAANFFNSTADFGYATRGVRIYQITSEGAVNLLASFDVGDDTPLSSTYGQTISINLVQGGDGNLYGTSTYGGENKVGIVFSVTQAGAFSVLHSFAAHGEDFYKNADGIAPQTALAQGKDGKFYGTTHQGGANGTGTIFSVTPAGEFTTLFTFENTSGAAIPSNKDGIYPGGLIQANDGNFYGTTSGGGATNNGTVFAVTPSGVLTTLYNFNVQTDGGYPPTMLLQAKNGYFFGINPIAGTNGFLGDGAIFVLALASPTLPVVTLSTSTPSVQVNGGAGEFTVSLSSAPTSKVLVRYAVKGSAANGTDYTLLSGTAKIKPGKTNKTVVISPQGDLGGAAKKVVKVSLYADPTYTVGTAQPIKIKLLRP